MDLIWPECRDSVIVFIDGHFDETRSHIPAPIVHSPLDQGGLSLFIPPHSELPCLQVLSLSSKSRLQILLGRGARLDLIETSGMTTDVVLEEGAHLNLVHWAEAQFLRATLKKEACLTSLSISEGGCQNIHVILSEEGAQARLQGLDRLSGEQESRTQVLVEHLAPHTRSHQHFQKVLKDRSRSCFEGKIRVESCAQKTEASQLSQNLVLSNQAHAHVCPALEIRADDVVVKHGATIAQIDAEEIFYCRARGLSETDAQELLLQGFYRELSIEIPAVRVRFL